MSTELRRCAGCGLILSEDDDYDERSDLPEFCSLCNDEMRDE